VIEFRTVSFAHPGRSPLLRDLSLRLEVGRTHALIGPSGCGKTTLLYLAGGLLAPNSGEVLVAGNPAKSGRRETGVILQDHGLFPWKTVRANLELGLRLRGIGKAERRGLADRALRETGIAGHDRKYPRELSGGERQRLAIARALVLEPDLLLLDEPFSALDAMTRERLQNRLAALAEGRNGPGSSGKPLTVLLVTHDIAEAAFLADRIHVMGTPAHRLSGDEAVTPRTIASVDNPLRPGLAADAHSASRLNDLRSSPSFFETCARVRALLENAGKTPGYAV